MDLHCTFNDHESCYTGNRYLLCHVSDAVLFCRGQTLQLQQISPRPQCVCVLLLIRVPLCDPPDCSPPGSSVHGILQATILEWLTMPPPGDLPDPGIEQASPSYPALAGRLFTTSGTWGDLRRCLYTKNVYFLLMTPVQPGLMGLCLLKLLDDLGWWRGFHEASGKGEILCVFCTGSHHFLSETTLSLLVIRRWSISHVVKTNFEGSRQMKPHLISRKRGELECF